MATHAQRFDVNVAFPGDGDRVYTACFFDHDAIVPRVQLLAAATDDDAIAQVRRSHRFKTRELWDRHRLVAVIPAYNH
jgi:hypothetical protein